MAFSFGGGQQPASSFGGSSFGGTGFGGQSGSGFGQVQAGGGSLFGGSGGQAGGLLGGSQNQGGGVFGANQGGSVPNPAAGSVNFIGVQNANNDYELPRTPESPVDSISGVAWSPTSNLLCSSSWDGKVRCYDVQQQQMSLNAQMKAYIEHQGPVLDVCFKSDGSGCFSGGVSGMVKMWRFESNAGLQNAQDVGKHDEPVRCVRWIHESNLLATAGWDKMLKYWDLRTPNPVLQVQLPGRCDCMDISHPYAVVATGGEENERQVVIYNLNNPSNPERVMNQPVAQTVNEQAQAMQKPLRKQFRAVSIFPDKSGFAISSIEGRCAIRYFPMNRSSDNFAFKCHRDKTTKMIYSINALSFHPTYGTFATVGSDGMWSFWDKDSKQRLKQSMQVKTSNGDLVPITCASFNAQGTLFAYGVSYDWSKGASGRPNGCMATVLVHQVRDEDVRPKNKSLTSSNRRW